MLSNISWIKSKYSRLDFMLAPLFRLRPFRESFIGWRTPSFCSQTTSRRIKRPTNGFKFLFSIKSISIPNCPRRYLYSACRASNGVSSRNSTNKSKSLVAVCDPCKNEPNTPSDFTPYCSVNSGKCFCSTRTICPSVSGRVDLSFLVERLGLGAIGALFIEKIVRLTAGSGQITRSETFEVGDTEYRMRPSKVLPERNSSALLFHNFNFFLRQTIQLKNRLIYLFIHSALNTRKPSKSDSTAKSPLCSTHNPALHKFGLGQRFRNFLGLQKKARLAVDNKGKVKCLIVPCICPLGNQQWLASPIYQACPILPPAQIAYPKPWHHIPQTIRGNEPGPCETSEKRLVQFPELCSYSSFSPFIQITLFWTSEF